jgi:hypothetical protein
MDPEEIRDWESLGRWLRDRPREDVIWIAQRAALRVLPLWVAEVSRPRKRRVDLTALPILRAILTSGVSRTYPAPEVTAAAAFAADAAVAARAAAAFAADAAAAADAAFAAAAADAAFAAAAAAAAAAFAAADADAAIWGVVRDDSVSLRDGTAEDRPLWPAVPDWLPLAQMRDTWAPATPGGDFWMRWYQGFLDGKPLPWDLQRDIALIPDEGWQKGEAHVAGLIAIIEERHRLLGLVAELKERLREATSVGATDIASPSHRSHNQPPELIDAPIAFRESVTLIRITLDEAEAELAKPTPEPSTLRRIADTLTAAVKTAATYCGAKFDVFITKAVEEGGSAFGKWGVMAAIAYFATPTGTMSALIKGLTDLAIKIWH